MKSRREAWQELGDILFPTEVDGFTTNHNGGIEPIALRIPEAAAAIGISRAEFFRLIGNGSIPSFKVGKMRLVAVSDLKTWVAQQRAEASPVRLMNGTHGR
jgi:excisionase family DNA binding protein